ncbi:MAG: hypothetical protein VX871_11450 [Pseudomonadota bacterium]|nr:hypothetical protein [Pseudomonadota bacterium]
MCLFSEADAGGETMRLAATIETIHGEAASVTGSLKADKATPAKDHLDANGIRAQLRATPSGAPAPAGGTAFATILLTNETEDKSVSAELVFDAVDTEIKSITGGTQKDDDGSGAKVVVVPKLLQRQTERITVELQLKDNAAAKGNNRLRVTLRQPGAASASDSTVLSWSVADCPGAYYNELVRIRETSAEAIATLLKSVQAPDRDRPGRWLFPPTASSRPGAACLKSEKYYDRRYRRTFVRCTEYETLGPDIDADILKREAQVLRFASPLVSRRTVDPELSIKRNAGWVSYKIGTDLQGYLTQPKSPAICTGVLEFTGYYRGKLSEVTSRIDMYSSNAEDSLKVARARVALARAAAANSTEGHPGWGAGPIDSSPPEGDASLRQLIAASASLTGDKPLQDSVAAAASDFEALQAMKAFLDGNGAAAFPKDVAAALRPALSAIEAADYIAATAGHYAAIDRHIGGSLASIDKAHADHCGCSR